MPTNAFGINDNFDPNYSHVIPALMLRMHEARLKKSNEITLWGTGSPLREFIYADDLARAFIFLMNKYEQYDEHINIGTMEEISIKDLALMVANVVGYQGNIRFDTSKPDGAIRKILNSKRLFELGWKPVTTLQDGLTIMYQHHFANN
jgi:GDP-L-fucose synthase